MKKDAFSSLMNTERKRSLGRPFAAVLIVVALAITAVAAASYFGRGTNGSSSTTLSPSKQNDAYLNVPNVYASLGYPKIAYNYYTTPYLPSEPNFTLEYRTETASFQVGSVQAPVVGLDEAVASAAAYLKLDPSNYLLGEAVFVPGTVSNNTLLGFPEWFLYFAQVHDGYWIYGNEGPQKLSLEVDVDALNGAVPHAEGDMSNPTNSAQYELDINQSRALQIVRAGSLPPGIPRALVENGTIGFMEPRVVIPGTVPGMTWLNSSVLGQGRLLWVIDMSYSIYGGQFYVDAGTGQLVTANVGEGAGVSIPIGPSSEGGSVAFSTAKNLTAAQETFQMNASIIGRSGSVGVVVPNALIAKPGAKASIQLNYSTFDIANPPNVTLSLANPLPAFQNFSSDGSPPGVSLQFSTPTLALLPGNGSAYATLLLSVDKNAPSGTYLIETDAKYFSQQYGVLTGDIQLMFFLSVWDGSGQWPPPPVVTTQTLNTTVSTCITASRPPVLPCGFGGNGTNFFIDSADLTAPTITGYGTNGNLTLTLTHSGDYEGWTVSVALNRTNILETPAVGAEHTYVIHVPPMIFSNNTYSVVKGGKYEVIVDLSSPNNEYDEELRVFLIAS